MRAYKITNVKTFYRFVETLMTNFNDTKTADLYLAPAFRDKILLAVTQVNGCRYCSYVHSKNALKNGVDEEEINLLLSGDFGIIDGKEASAIFFAQHYAENRGYYDEDLFQMMKNMLGDDKTRAVMGTIRKIMVGNTHGIAMDLLKMRLQANADENSHFKDEIGIFFGIFFMIPYVLFKQLIQKIKNDF